MAIGFSTQSFCRRLNSYASDFRVLNVRTTVVSSLCFDRFSQPFAFACVSFDSLYDVVCFCRRSFEFLGLYEALRFVRRYATYCVSAFFEFLLVVLVLYESLEISLIACKFQSNISVVANITNAFLLNQSSYKLLLKTVVKRFFRFQGVL